MESEVLQNVHVNFAIFNKWTIIVKFPVYTTHFLKPSSFIRTICIQSSNGVHFEVMYIII